MTPDEDDDAGDRRDVVVGAHVRRPPRADLSWTRRRSELTAERSRLLARIEALETELHACQADLRGVERSWPPGRPISPRSAGNPPVQTLDTASRAWRPETVEVCQDYVPPCVHT